MMQTNAHGWRLALTIAGLAAAMIHALSTAVAAQNQEGAGTRTEVLMLVPPPGWELAMNQRNDQMFVIQYVPPGQSVDNWREMVQAQIFFGVVDLAPTEFLDNMHALYADACQGVRAEPNQLTYDFGYATSQRVLACGRNAHDNLGGVSMFKAIQGRESLYAITRAWRGPAYNPSNLPVSTETLAAWADFFTSIRLCDNRNPNAPCPRRRTQ